jgi:hypothetical protein
VALLTGLFESAMMRIQVTGCAGRKMHVLEPRRPPGDVRLVAFLAIHLNVQAGQGIACLRVIELFRSFPVAYVVTTLTIRPQLAFMKIFVAGGAVRGEPNIGSRNIFLRDEAFDRLGYMGRRVTFLASHRRVLAFERVSRLTVIKLSECRLPMYEREIHTVMFQMAANTVLTIGILDSQQRVVAVAFG